MIVEYVAALCERLGDPGEYAFFFFNDTATTEIYTLSLHDALPISYASARCPETRLEIALTTPKVTMNDTMTVVEDRKRTRLNSSHLVISYAVFCLKKKKIARISRLAHLAQIPPWSRHAHATTRISL